MVKKYGKYEKKEDSNAMEVLFSTLFKITDDSHQPLSVNLLIITL